MPSFPASVKSFATKNVGDVIQPADVNDLQDEVNAVEAGWLQGTAGLNSSNSTLANLSVLGKSTLVGNVQMNGNCTVTGTLVAGAFTLTGSVTADAQPRARAFLGSTQTINSASETALTFDSDDFNVGALHSTGTQPTRMTLPSTGVWQFGATCHFTATTQSAYLRFQKNGATGIGASVRRVGDGATSKAIYLTLTQIEQISTIGDYVEVIAWQNAGAPLVLGSTATRIDQNEFWAVKLW